MYPTNQYMDPYYSHFRNHAPYSYYPPLVWEAGQPRMMDSSYRPPSYGPWPYNSGMHQPHPSEFHCCCNHPYPPGPGHYGFRPPFPQELPPAHLYYHGPFPQHPNEFPSYFARPHPYPVEQAPYEYDKFKNHCCGCPNHVCHGGEKSNVKIEEESPDRKPERELKGADNSSIIHYPKNQYPVAWLSSGNLEDKENGKRYELPPQFLNRWVPVDGKKSEDVKKQGQHDQKEQQYPWPIIWMSAGDGETKQKARELKEKDENPKVTEKTPSSPKIKIIPLSWFEDQKLASKSGSRVHSDRSAVESHPEHRDRAAVEGHHEATPVVPRKMNDETKRHQETTQVVPRGMNEETKPARENYRTIPVLPEKESGEKKVGTCRTIPVMNEKENYEKKPAVTEKKVENKASSAEKQGENGKGNHSESPTAKHSKLPPVCLRLDPLPRKKSVNGSTRSLSPPMRKDAEKVKKDMNETQSQNLEPKESYTKKHTVVPEMMKEKSPDDLKKGVGFSNETLQAASVKHSQEEEVPRNNDNQKVEASGASVQTQENADANTYGGSTQENTGAETLKGGDKNPDTDSEILKANLSEGDAAVRIQSAYKGYDVRRWQPLDKLRKIRDVHEQMQGVRKQLQSLEASCKKPTEKEQMAIGEAIMNLLLKLDTLQGLHPCVREARKSVARELICLQEKLDSLCKQPSDAFEHTNEGERLDRAESIVHTAAPASIAEASDNEEKAVGSSETNETSPVDSMKLCDAMPSEVNLEPGQDADPSELNSQEEKPYTSRIEVPREQGNAAEKVEFQEVSSAHMTNVGALPEHPCDNHEHQREESNAGSQETNEEEKKVAVVDERQEMPLVDSMGPSHDAAPTVDSSMQEKCMASTVQSFHSEEANSGVSPAVTGDTEASTATDSLDNGLAVDNDVSVEDHTREAIGVETPKLKHDVSPAEETQDVTILEDPTTAADSVMSNAYEKPEEARNMNVQEQVADSTHDSSKEQGGIPEASMDDMEHAASEEPAQTLLEPTLEFDALPEQSVLEESNNTMQSGLGGKDEVSHVDQKNEVLELRGELDIPEKNKSLSEVANPSTETLLPELDSSRSSCTHEGVITGYDPEIKVPLDSQTANQDEGSCADADAPKTPECTEMPKEAPGCVMGDDSAQEVDACVSRIGEGNETPNNSTVYTAGATSAEMEADETKEPPAGVMGADSVEEVVSKTGECNETPNNFTICTAGVSAEVEADETKEAPAGVMEADSVIEVDPRVSETGECNETPNDSTICSAPAATAAEVEANETKEAPAGVMGADYVKEVVSETEECNETPNDSTICAAGATSAKVEADKAKEDVSVQTESKASEEASITSDGAKDNDEKKLAEENQKLKELLQKLLASGNDQMEVITDLSEKVKVLERKLARKKKPKVRVRRHAAAKVH